MEKDLSKIDIENGLLIDIRDNNAYLISHIKGSYNIPLVNIQNYIEKANTHSLNVGNQREKLVESKIFLITKYVEILNSFISELDHREQKEKQIIIYICDTLGMAYNIGFKLEYLLFSDLFTKELEANFL